MADAGLPAPSAAPVITVQIDRERNLKFDFNALSHAERILKKNFLQRESWQGISIGDMVALVWCAAIHEDKSLKVETVGAAMHPGNLPYWEAVLAKAFANSMPEDEEGEDDDDPLPENVSRLHGSSSGPSDE